MNIYLFALASLLFVVPIVYLLPLGLSKKGKLIVICVPFALSLLGISANSLFEWWKLALLVFILVILSSYLLDRKMKDIFLVSENEDTKSRLEPSATFFEKGSVKEVNVIEELAQANPIEEETNEYFVEEILEINLEKEENDEVELSQDLFIEADVIVDNEIDDASLTQEEESDNHKEVILEETEIGYMSELERLMLDESEALSLSNNTLEKLDEQNPLLENDLDENTQVQDQEYLEILSQFEEIEQVPGKSDLLEEALMVDGKELDHTSIEDQEYLEMLSQVEEIEQVPEKSELLETIPPIEDKQFGELSSENQEDYLEVLSQLELAEEEAASSTEQLIDEPDPLLIEDFTEGELIKETINDPNEKNHFQNQLFNTIIDQVKLAEKALDSKKYEQFLRECMHKDMPNSEYFTFASYLIQHYISKKEFTKLQDLLVDLEEKYKEYPILLQQVQFLLTFYQKKIDEKK